MSKALHVCLITPGFPANEADEKCTPYVQDFLRAFTEAHPQIRFSVVAIQYPYCAKPYRWNGINVYPCNGRNKKGLNKLFPWRTALKQLSKIDAESKIDIVHSLWLTEATFLAQFWVKKPVNHVATAMGQDVLKSNAYLRFLQLEKLQLVCVSSFQQKLLEKISSASTSVISWEVNDLPKSLPEKSIDILGVGSLIKLKRFDQFISVLTKITHQKNVRACILGDGPERKNLEVLSKRLPENISLEFLGEIPRSEVLTTMAKSKVLLHCADYESQGYVFNEALSRGMAIVSKNVGCATEMDQWKVANNEEQMVEAVNHFLALKREPKSLSSAGKMVGDYYKLYTS